MSGVKQTAVAVTVTSALLFIVGCGATQNLTSAFMSVDNAQQTVTLKLVSGYNSQNDYQNFDGYANGQMVVTVPQGYQVKLDVENNGGIPADVGVYDAAGHLAFKGAGDSISDIVGNPVAGVEPGKSETLTFTASAAGTYRIDNLLYSFPQFSQPNRDTGMWIQLDVVPGGTPSVQAN